MIAGTPEAIETARYALGHGFEYRLAYTVEEAMSLLSPDIDLILCNVAFDDSRMFDFIREARSLPAPRAIPLICFRHQKRALTKAMHDAIETALSLFPETFFLDLYELNQQGGLLQALTTFREATFAHLPAKPHRAEEPLGPAGAPYVFSTFC